MRAKKCVYCKKKFFDIEFPSTFDRMITCGSIECTGIMRRELLRKRHGRQLAHAAYA